MSDLEVNQPPSNRTRVSEVPALQPEEFRSWLEASLRAADRTQSLFRPLGDDTCILILAGPRASGKTTLSSQIAHGLGDDARFMGWIPTELAGASTTTDISRVKEANTIISAVGIEGCACCAAVEEVLEQVDKFRQDNRRLIVIEISTHSNAGDPADRLTKRGIPTAVVAIQNPGQLGVFPHDTWLQVRSACAVWATHVEPSDPQYDRKIELVRDYVDSVPPKWDMVVPIIPSAGGDSALRELMEVVGDTWDRIVDSSLVTINSSKGGLDTVGAEARRKDAERKKDVRYFNEIVLLTYPGVSPEQVIERLGEYRDALGRQVVERGKGWIDGVEVDIWREADGLKLALRGAATGSPFGVSYIAVSSTDSLFRERFLADLAVSVGMMADLSEDTVNRIRDDYPTLGQMQDVVRGGADGNLVATFPEDRFLLDFLRILPRVNEIPDPTTRSDLLYTVYDLATEFFRVRADLLSVLKSEVPADHPRRSEILTTSAFLALKVLNHPLLEGQWKSLDDDFSRQAQRLDAENPGWLLLEGLSLVEKLAINQEANLTPGDLAVFHRSLERLEERTEDRDALVVLLGAAESNVRRLIASEPENERIQTWRGVADLYANARVRLVSSRTEGHL